MVEVGVGVDDGVVGCPSRQANQKERGDGEGAPHRYIALPSLAPASFT